MGELNNKEIEVAEQTEFWVRVGGGLEQSSTGERYGPADLESPPRGGPWRPLFVEERLVGWMSATSELDFSDQLRQEGERRLRERQAKLLGRLGHKLRSSVLALQECARQAAFGRPDQLEPIYDQAQEVGRRAAALEVVTLRPPDSPRAVVLGAVLNLAAPQATRELPGDALVQGSEPALIEALSRAYEWMGGAGCRIRGERRAGWWRLELNAAAEREPLALPELGKPLVGYLIEAHLDGWLKRGDEMGAIIYLPSAD
ncbi:MAG: hypothetical protein ACREN8_02755 [Candidatus Dormibacteraceae bacterium]